MASTLITAITSKQAFSASTTASAAQKKFSLDYLDRYLQSLPYRNLNFYHIHTGEKLEVTYWENGRYVMENLQQTYQFLRDHRSGESSTISIDLLDKIFLMKDLLDYSQPINIVSAYRSEKTNEYLRKTTGGVAKNSFHLHGRALDIVLPKIPLDKTYRLAKKLGNGGVGYYASSGFIHLDTGPNRHWRYR